MFEPGGDATTTRPIPFRAAVVTWLVTWTVGMLVVAQLVLGAFGVEGDDYTIPEFALATVGAWLVMLAGLVYVSSRYGTDDPLADFRRQFAVEWKPIDLLGLPMGVLVQFVVPVLYIPLRALWPSTFSTDEIEERAQELADKAGGANAVLLIVIVAICAPLMEELIYRGLLQHSLSREIGKWRGLLAASVWFMLVHVTPVEFPGLLLAGLSFGIWLTLTGRIGGAILTHVGFNLTALVITLWL